MKLLRTQQNVTQYGPAHYDHALMSSLFPDRRGIQSEVFRISTKSQYSEILATVLKEHLVNFDIT
jgi:hypothetical protein